MTGRPTAPAEPARGRDSVAYITSRFPLVPEVFIATDIRALEGHGWRVSVHALRSAPGDAAERAREWGVTHVPRTDNSLRATLRGLLAMARWSRTAVALVGFALRHTAARPGHLVRTLVLLPRVFDIIRELRRTRPAVVHAFWGHYPALVLRAAETLLPDARRSLFLGAYDLTMGYGASGPVARRSDVVFTHAHANRPDLLRLGIPEDRIEVVHRGIELHRVPDPGEVDRVPGRVLAVGRMIPEKGFDRVLDAFARVRREVPGAALELIGDGPSRATLEERVRLLGLDGVVVFRGMLPHREVLFAMASAEVLVALSFKKGERLPNVIKEALACGTPVVAARTPGMEELVRNGRAGRVVEPGDTAAAAEAITTLLRVDPAERRARHEMARAFIREHFDNRGQMARYAARWRALIGTELE